MSLTDDYKKELAAYQSGPFEDLTVQDALAIISVYAIQMDLEDSQEDIKRIEGVLEKCEFCVEKKEGIFSRINNFANRMQAIDPLKAVEIAVKILKPEIRETAFELATEVAMPDHVLTDERKEALDTLATKLSIGEEFVKKTIANFS